MQNDSFSKLPGWQMLSRQEQTSLVSLVQNPSTFSQLLALQQAMLSSDPNHPGDAQRSAETAAAASPASQVSSIACQGCQSSSNTQGTSHLAKPTVPLPSFSGFNRELPSTPQLDRSLLQSPLSFWTAPAGCNGPASLLAANTNATQRSMPGFNQASQPLADFSSELFRSTSLGSRYLRSPLPAELSLRASSMPGSFQDIAARLHLNRAGISTATASMIPVLSQDWLAIPFGTAQQLLPVYAGDVLADNGGDAVMLIDENGRNWPMKCAYSRSEGRYQLGEGWKAFAQHWDLAHGEQLQLSRRFVSSGCIWLDVCLERGAPAPEPAPGRDGCAKRKREDSELEANKMQSPVAAWISQARTAAPSAQQHAAVSLQDQSEIHDRPPKTAKPASPEPRPIISVKRLISCPTYCSRLHVNQHMAEHLLPVLPEAASIKPPLSYVYQSLFKHKIKIVDDNGEAWMVQYEGFVSAAQRHYRFTAGWTNLVKQKGVKVGDAVVLERWTSDRFKLHMHIIKNASDSIIASATTGKGKAKRSTARKVKSLSKSGSTSRPAPKSYSPGSLEALHDAALLCANSPSPAPRSGTAAAPTQNLALNLDLADSEEHGGSGVPAAAVAAADAAALNLEGSKLAMAAGLIALKADSEQQQHGAAVPLAEVVSSDAYVD